jgi:hypothetical protein
MDVSLAPSFGASDVPRLDLPLARSPLPTVPQRGREIVELPSVQLGAISSVEPEGDSSVAEPPAVQRAAQSDMSRPSSTGWVQTLPLANAPMASMTRVSVSRLPLIAESPARVARFSLSAPDVAAMAPLAGARPLRPTTSLQRDASRDTAPTLTLPQRGREDQRTLVQRGMDDAPALVEDSAPTLTLPQRGSEDHATPVQTAIEDGRDGRLPLAPSRGISVQRASDDTPLPDPPAQGEREILQGTWYEAPMTVSRVSAGTATSESSTASAGPHRASETEMDELARRLYDRLRTRLKTELLVDRERAGFLTDLR